MAMRNKGVRALHREYEEYLPLWEQCSHAVDGQRAIHKQGKRYLPKLAGEKDEAYKARLMRSDFFNATWRTIAGLTGMAFRKDPEVAVPAAIEPFLPNIDLAGRDLTTVAKDIVEDVLEYGRIGVLVDHPPLPDNVQAITVAVGEKLGIRPMLKTYDAKCITNWRYSTVRATRCLTRLRDLPPMPCARRFLC